MSAVYVAFRSFDIPTVAPILTFFEFSNKKNNKWLSKSISFISQPKHFYWENRKKNAGCEARTHDLGIMRPALFQLSQTRCDLLSKQTYISPTPPFSSHVFMNEKIKIRFNHLFNYTSGDKRERYKE